jgi:hypothetical protein
MAGFSVYLRLRLWWERRDSPLALWQLAQKRIEKYGNKGSDLHFPIECA